MKPNFVPGMGSPNAKLIVIGEAPGFHEDQARMPFVGPSGKLLDELLELAGVPRSEVYVTNVFKYRPPGNDVKRIGEILTREEIETSYTNLWKEIASYPEANCLLLLGGTALEVITGVKGINKYRGSLLKSINHNKKCIPTLHPANLLPGSPSMLAYSARAYIQLDISKAVRESRSSEYKSSQRDLSIAKSSLDLTHFLRRFENESTRRILACDIETYKSIPTCISFSYSRHSAISIPLCLMGGRDPIVIQMHELQELWRMVGATLANPTIRIIGQNFKFDQERLRNTCLMEVSNFYADTMLIAHTLYPEFPRGLYFLTSIYTNEPYYKDEYKDFDPKRDSVSRILLYNAKDSVVTYEVFEEQEKELEELGLTSFYFDYVHLLHKFYFDLEETGYSYNTHKQSLIRRKYDILARRSEREFFDLIGEPYNSKFINSPKQISNLLYGKLGFPTRANTEEDTLVALLSNHTHGKPEKARILNAILDTRRYKKTVSTYISAPPDYDGRMRSSYNIMGTETGRSSTGKYGKKVKGGGRKSPTRPTEAGLAFQTTPERGIGHEIQRCFQADPGYELFSIDLSQAEARVVALLAEDYELLTLFDTVDIHKLTASWFFDKSKEDITKEERFIGKVGRHGGHYDMHKGKLCNSIMSDARRFGIDVIISEKRAGELLTIFHKFSPRIRSVFHKSVQETLRRERRVIITPHGRRRQFFSRWSEDLFREAYAYIPQATVRDHLSQAGLRIKEQMPEILFQKESHDAFKGEYPIHLAEKARDLLRRELATPIDFSKCSIPRGKLVIPSELQVGQNLGNMVKV